MNVHINDYNFLMSLMPEIEIYNTIIQFIDKKETLNNFLTAFPVLKLLCKFDKNCFHIGTFNFYNKSSITFTDKVKYYSYFDCIINVYECINRKSFNNTRNNIKYPFLLIHKNKLYLNDNDVKHYKIRSVGILKYRYVNDFIYMIKKHKNI